MPTDHAALVFTRAAKDLVVALAGDESAATWLDSFARRRASAYAPGAAPEADDSYWPALATAMAAIAPPEGMPMAGLVTAGITLERGARGLRGLFTSTPSEKDRKRVLRVATLAARVMAIVVGPEASRSADTRRALSMAIASFGLAADELASVRPSGTVTESQLEIFGELESRVRRELLRGAWTLALGAVGGTAADNAVRAVAARLDLSDQCELMRTETETLLARLRDTATLALELARASGAELSMAELRPGLEHLVRAAALPLHAGMLREQLESTAPVTFDQNLRTLDRGRRVQAVAIAWTTLLMTNPPCSTVLQLRSAITRAAGDAGAAYEVPEALEVVDRYLYHRVAEATVPVPVVAAP